MKNFILPILLFLAVSLQAKDIDLKTTITEVTVFQSGAQVKRIGTTIIPAGEYNIVIRDATSQLKKESIQVKGDGNFTILSVNHQINLGNQNQDKAKWLELEAKEKDLKRKMEDISIKIEVLRTEEAVINNLQNISTTTEGVTVEQVSKAQDLLKVKLTLIKNEKLIASRQMKEFYDAHQSVTQQLSALKTPKQNINYEIVIKVKAKAETNANFIVTYIVPNANWFPTYDLRVKTIAEPMVIDYKANVSQQSGEDWNNVKLKLSTGDPSLSSEKPKVETWLLYLNQPYIQPQKKSNFYRYTDVKFTKLKGTILDKSTGEPLPFCSIMVEGTNIGTSSDLDGNFNLVLPENARNIKVAYIGYEQQILPIKNEEMKIYLESSQVSLNEVVIANYSSGQEYEKDEWKEDKRKTSISSSYTENKNQKTATNNTVTQTLNIVNTEFNIEEKYSIISNPKSITVAIQTFQTKANYQYYCAPRLDKDVFLTAQIVDWEKYNLIEGQGNIFFEGTFVGNTLLDTRYITDTLEISLGRDKSVKVDRKKSKEFNKHTFFGGENIAYREWDIAVKNGKQQNVDIIIEDQFPIAADSKIVVKQEEKSGGKLDEKTGIVSWQYLLEPNGIKTMQLKYSAKFPKGSFIGLD
ncbi:MAG: mucoidy inhibitor MuiA family protein [Bacteroidetes bacterium]|nr:mucoidy inhibitor MuiA family protein [Bacteroidota bacterium]